MTVDADFYNRQPVRRGAIYCAPWCGANCTHASFIEAGRKADALAAELGPAWEAVRWENLGWHWKARTRDGRLKLHPSGSGFTAFLSPDASSGGRWTESATTPRAAIKAVLERALDELDDISVMIKTVRYALEK